MKKNNSLMLWIIGIGLLAFTAYRSFHLVTQSLPGDAQIMGFAALFGLDLGLLAWTNFAGSHARGDQITIANIMVVVDLLGVGAALLADTLLMSNAGYKDLIGTVAGFVLPIIIILNISGVIFCKLRDPEQIERNAERDAEEVFREAMRQRRLNDAAKLADEVAGEMYPQHREAIAAKYRASFTGNGNNGLVQRFADRLNGHKPDAAPTVLARDTPEVVEGEVTPLPKASQSRSQ